MGLDMDLIIENKNNKDLNASYYWRKVNHIHFWFIDHIKNGVENCEDHLVTKELLLKLKKDTQSAVNIYKSAVLDNNGNIISADHISKLKKIFSYGEGFIPDEKLFDTFCHEENKRVLEFLNRVTSTFNLDDCNIVYSASW